MSEQHERQHAWNPHDGSGVRTYLQVLRRRKWIFLLALILVPLIAVALSLRQTPLYQASAQVLLKYQNLAGGISGIQDVSGVYQDPTRIAATQAKVAMVPAVADRVAAAVGLRRTTAGDFLANASVSVQSDADILDFRHTDRNRIRAARLATEHARQFIAYRQELDTANITAAQKELRQRIQQLQASGATGSAAYAKLVESAQQLRTLGALQTSNATLVHPADGAAQIQPRPVRNGIFGFALGLILGLGLAFLVEALDTRIRSANDVAERLGLPLLARLPEPPRRLRKKNLLTMLAEPTSMRAEAVRLLRTNIEFVNLDRDARAIMITSAVEREGKSTTIANLAIAEARAGRRTLLVDLDLRRPLLHRFFDLEGPGLTDVVLGHASLEEAIKQIPLAHPKAKDVTRSSRNGRVDLGGFLHVLPAGHLPPDPSEFIGSPRLTQLLDSLREQADVVYVDAPPLLHVGDALALSSKVDGMVVAVRLDIARRPMLTELARVLERVPAAKLGFVLTNAEGEDGYGGYGGYGGYYNETGTRRQRAEERV